MPQDLTTPVLRNLDLGNGNYLVEFEVPEMTRRMEPAQFFMIGIPGAETLLRRPYSVCGLPGTFSDAPPGAVQVLYKVLGRGTALLSTLKPGASIDVLGPLGRGFSPPGREDVRPVLVAGGIGSAPFPALLQRDGRSAPPLMFYGARTAGDLPLLGWFREHCAEVVVTTDDGSAGHKGLVTEPLTGLLDEAPADSVKLYACGPEPMLKAVARLALARGVACELALEAHMACGFGVCLGCVVPTHAGPGAPVSYERVCVEGPVMSAERLGMVTPDLSVELGPLRLKNPMLTASGTFGYGLEFLPFFDIGELGGLVSKGLSPRPREGNPPARIVETPAGMLNTIGLQNIGVDAFISNKLPELAPHDTAIIANVFGESEAEYVEVCRKLDGAAGLAAIELNVSCPNTEQGGMIFGNDPVGLARITRVCRKATRLPLIVKLSPNVTDIRDTARAAEDEGADILSLVNTFVGMAIDVDARRPVLANVSGGLSGPAIRPLAVWMTWRVHQAVRIPLIGMGGIMSGRDALEFILAGASAVQVGTGNFIHPDLALRVLRELRDYLVAHEIHSIRELVGSLSRGA